MFTHNVLYACDTPDKVEERGAINRDQAIGIFRSFPFASELAKRAENSDLTVPTITFKDVTSNACFAIWSEVPGVYVLWLPSVVMFADGVADTAGIERCVSLFFAGRLDEVERQMAKLGNN